MSRRPDRSSRSCRALSALSTSTADLRQDAKERLDRSRIERLAGFLLDQRGGRFDRHRLVIRPVRRQRVEVVDEAQNPRAERDLLALEPARIAAAVPALVMV